LRPDRHVDRTLGLGRAADETVFLQRRLIVLARRHPRDEPLQSCPCPGNGWPAAPVPPRAISPSTPGQHRELPPEPGNRPVSGRRPARRPLWKRLASATSWCSHPRAPWQSSQPIATAQEPGDHRVIAYSFRSLMRSFADTQW